MSVWQGAVNMPRYAGFLLLFVNKEPRGLHMLGKHLTTELH
jgi:hypothetical protein